MSTTCTSLPALLLRSVEQQPDAVAIVDGSSRVNYATLWERVRTVAGFLTEMNIGQGDRVALFLDNSVDYVVAYYAVLLSGGVVVAMNTAAKARDIDTWVRHSDASLLIADANHPEYAAILERMAPTLPIIALGQDTASAPNRYAWVQATTAKATVQHPGDLLEDGLAAIIYTSGTTGNPKGVTLTHRNLCSNTQSILQYLRLQPDDSIVNVLPFFYSYGNSILHTHLAVGARIVLEKSMLYPVQVLNRMVEERVTGFSGVPSTYSILLNRVTLGQFDLSSLRYMTQAGGPMAPADVHRLVSMLPKVRFFVMYGQTEASARLAYLPPEKLVDKLGSIGVPVPGVRIEIHGPDDRELEPHVPGELRAQGQNIMHGYWNDPETTQQVLRNGWLHTGDIAYRDEDGYLYIVGRATDMIKTGAHRISPKEIEEVVLELDGVAETVAIGVPDPMLGQAIKLIVVPKPGAELDMKGIQRHCRQNLASYKIPKFIEFSDSLPRTASGKVQRFKLQ